MLCGTHREAQIFSWRDFNCDCWIGATLIGFGRIVTDIQIVCEIVNWDVRCDAMAKHHTGSSGRL